MFPDQADEMGQTPLILAARSGRTRVVVEVMRALLDCEGDTALIKAAVRGRGAVVDVLLERGASIEAKGRYVAAALLRVVGGGHRDVAELLRRGADGEARDLERRFAAD